MLVFPCATKCSIKIAGQDIKGVSQTSLRQAVGVVPQDTVLFNDTIGYNIAYGDLAAGAEEVTEAARKAQLDAPIAGMPQVRGVSAVSADGAVDVGVSVRLFVRSGSRNSVAWGRTFFSFPATTITYLLRVCSLPAYVETRGVGELGTKCVWSIFFAFAAWFLECVCVAARRPSRRTPAVCDANRGLPTQVAFKVVACSSLVVSVVSLLLLHCCCCCLPLLLLSQLHLAAVE